MDITLVQCGRDPNCIDEGLQQIVENHRPSGKKSEMGIQTFADVGVGRSCRGVKRAHASIADCRDQHTRKEAIRIMVTKWPSESFCATP